MHSQYSANMDKTIQLWIGITKLKLMTAIELIFAKVDKSLTPNGPVLRQSCIKILNEIIKVFFPDVKPQFAKSQMTVMFQYGINDGSQWS